MDFKLWLAFPVEVCNVSTYIFRIQGFPVNVVLGRRHGSDFMNHFLLSCFQGVSTE